MLFWSSYQKKNCHSINFHGHSMFRPVDRPLLSFRQRASEWIYKMFFLWSKQLSQIPNTTRTGPWLAWFATAVLLWRCRRRITKAILAVSPLRPLKRNCSSVTVKLQGPPKLQNSKARTDIKTRIKRLCTGDGPHVTNSATLLQSKSQHIINYRVTRSGRVYGKYQHRIVTPRHP